MRRLAYGLLILASVGVMGQTVGKAVLSRLTPAELLASWPVLLLCGVCGVLLQRLVRLEQSLVSTQQQQLSWQAREQEASVQLADLAHATQQLASAVQSVQSSLAAYEWLWPGKLLVSQRRYDDAIKAFQEALACDPEHPTLHWALGEAFYSAKRYGEALPHLRAGLRPENAAHLAMLAQCEQLLGHHAEAEACLLRLLTMRGAPRQEDLLMLATVQSELAPERARDTLQQALALNPYNSAVRYQLMDLELRLEAYERVIALATEGVTRNPADVGCCVSRADAYFRRGLPEDEEALLQDLLTTQAKNRKDYNIYRLRGALYQRRASRTKQPAESQAALHQALEAYTEGLATVPTKFHAHLFALQSRVLLQLKRFDEAIIQAQRAVEHYAGHVSNHLALAFARLAARQWQAAAQAAEQGLPWAGRAGKIWLTAIHLLARVCAGDDLTTLRPLCVVLTEALEANARHFNITESWGVVREVLWEEASRQGQGERELTLNTIALLEGTVTPADYRSKWAGTPPLPTFPSAS
ncbi:MAG: tetratricopeptide repeat protein [Candidatus Tectimicrobiota bacterium]